MLIVGILALLLFIVCIGIIYLYLHQARLLSPLPLRPGLLLQTRQDKGDVELQRLLTARGISYTTINHSADGYIVFLNPKQQVILSRNKDLSEQISALQIILPQLTMKEKPFTRLDLRYNKPVVVY